jgi:hypothetical protein
MLEYFGDIYLYGKISPDMVDYDRVYWVISRYGWLLKSICQPLVGGVASSLVACCSCCRPPGFERNILLLIKNQGRVFSPWFSFFL